MSRSRSPAAATIVSPRAYGCSKGFLGRADVSECAQYALRWLTDGTGVQQSIALVRAAGEPVMAAAASRGLPAEGAGTFAISLDDWNNPLVATLGRPHTFFAAAHSQADRRRRPSTPFEDAPFHAVPLGFSNVASQQRAFGLLLLGGPNRLVPELEWFTAVFSQKLDQILRQRRWTEGDRKQGRERSLLYSIINAVTDPILLTDTEGRLLIANAAR